MNCFRRKKLLLFWHAVVAMSYCNAMEVSRLAVSLGDTLVRNNVSISTDALLRSNKELCLSGTSPAECQYFLAARLGFPSFIEESIEEGVAIAVRDSEGRTALHVAARHGNKKIVELLVSRGVPVNIERKKGLFGETGITPLHEAVQGGHQAVVKYLIEKGAFLEAKTEKGKTPLLLAVKKGFGDIAHYLVKRGAEVMVQDEQGRDIFEWAVIRGDQQSMDAILEITDEEIIRKRLQEIFRKGAIKSDSILKLLTVAKKRWYKKLCSFLIGKGIEHIEGDDKGQLIPFALWLGSEEYLNTLLPQEKVVKALLTKGIDIKATDAEGWRSLYSVTKGGKKEFIDIVAGSKPGEGTLLSAVEAGNGHEVRISLLMGADVNAKVKQGTTVLHLAVQAGNKEVIEQLLVSGADIHAKTSYSWRALSEAIDNKSLKVFFTLADLKAVDDLARRHWLALEGSKEVVELLLAKGADIHAKRNDGITVLHGAALGGRKEVIELLLAKGADIHAKTDSGFTVLLGAALGGNKEVIELLLAKGADIHAKMNDGRTVLYGAALGGNKEVVELLLAKGADMHTKTNDGITVLHSAIEKGNKEIVELLLANGADVNECIYGYRPFCWRYLDLVKAEEMRQLLKKYGVKPGYWFFGD